MSKVLFIGDLHLGHKNVLSFSKGYREGDTIEEHDGILIDKLCRSVNKRDVLYVLGDVTLSKDIAYLYMLIQIPGELRLIRGNHDNHFTTRELLEVFDRVEGFSKYKRHWLSHCPIHPAELRGKSNIHGHVHTNSIPMGDRGLIDTRYINVCVEALNGYPISYQNIVNGRYWEIKQC